MVSGGGDAYAWLKSSTSVRQIAYTWFEYDIPPADLPKLQAGAGPKPFAPEPVPRDQLAAARQKYADDPDPGPHLQLAVAAINGYDYRSAFEEIRSILGRDPANKQAFALGGELIRTPVGEIHVAEKIGEVGAVIGGEGNGGVILPEAHLGRDAPVAVVLTLQHMVEFGGPLSALWKSLPRYTMTKKKVAVGGDPDRIIRRIGSRHGDAALNWDDGLKISFGKEWVHIRKSNTEPIIRIISEAPTSAESAALCDRFIEEIAALS